MESPGNRSVFNLARSFSILSFLLITLAGTVFGVSVTQYTTTRINAQSEHDNVALTHLVYHAMHEEFVAMLNATTIDEKSVDQHTKRLKQLVHDSAIVKIKAIDMTGRVVFSTDPAQLGKSEQKNAKYHLARAGLISSNFYFREQFQGIYRELENVHLIGSYVPMREWDGSIQGVIEVYREVSPLIERSKQILWFVAAGVVLVVLVLYVLQLMVVIRGQRIILYQASALQELNQVLESRVKERTAALQRKIHEHRQSEKRLAHLAHHDPLTGLPNRLLFKVHLEQSLQRCKRHQGSLAVLFIDMDQFKDINDSLGHSIGDRLLQAVAQRIRGSLRASDILARQSGDEFICMVDDDHNSDEAVQIAEKLLAQFCHPFDLDEHCLYMSVSIGICLAPEHGDSVEVLIRNADSAMHQAKNNGRNCFTLYSDHITHMAQERMQLSALIRQAIENNEMQLYFQPKVDTASKHLSGAEALLRWHHPQLGTISPDKFIPIAEDNGQIIELGAWVLQQSLQQLRIWDARGLVLPSIAINLSVKQLERENYLEQIGEIISHSGIDPVRIELEITESVIMSIDHSLDILNEIRRFGVSLAVDDFGTGYSSLSYLKSLPIQTLKIDRSFILGVGRNNKDEAIIRTIIELARRLGLKTVAEGVETNQQLEFLHAHGCNQIQGYLYGKPVSASDFFEQWQGQAPINT